MMKEFVNMESQFDYIYKIKVNLFGYDLWKFKQLKKVTNIQGSIRLTFLDQPNNLIEALISEKRICQEHNSEILRVCIDQNCLNKRSSLLCSKCVYGIHQNHQILDYKSNEDKESDFAIYIKERSNYCENLMSEYKGNHSRFIKTINTIQKNLIQDLIPQHPLNNSNLYKFIDALQSFPELEQKINNSIKHFEEILQIQFSCTPSKETNNQSEPLNSQQEELQRQCKQHEKEIVSLCVEKYCNGKQRLLCSECLSTGMHKQHKLLEFQTQQQRLQFANEIPHQKDCQEFLNQFDNYSFDIFKQLQKDLSEKFNLKILKFQNMSNQQINQYLNMMISFPSIQENVKVAIDTFKKATLNIISIIENSEHDQRRCQTHGEKEIIKVCMDQKCQSYSLLCEDCLLLQSHNNHIENLRNYPQTLQLINEQQQSCKQFLQNIDAKIKKLSAEKYEKLFLILQKKFGYNLFKIAQMSNQKLNEYIINLRKYPQITNIIEKIEQASNLHTEDQYLNKGKVYFEQDEFEKAIIEFDNALKKNPSSIIAILYKGDSLRLMNKYSRSLEFYDQILIQNPNNKNVLASKGESLRMLEEFQEAIKCYDKALQQDPQFFQALFGKGESLRMIGQYLEAINCLNQALKINKDDSICLASKGACLIELKKYNEAYQLLVKALKLDENSEWIQNLLSNQISKIAYLQQFKQFDE